MGVNKVEGEKKNIRIHESDTLTAGTLNLPSTTQVTKIFLRDDEFKFVHCSKTSARKCNNPQQM